MLVDNIFVNSLFDYKKNWFKRKTNYIFIIHIQFVYKINKPLFIFYPNSVNCKLKSFLSKILLSIRLSR